MMFYSGDTDGVIPTFGSKQWIKGLGWNVVKPWQNWITKGQVSGYFESYEGGFDFVTVRGVGHMAP